MRGKVPDTFPFNWREWLTSPTILHMGLMERGAFITLLIVQWRQGFVTDEDLTGELGLSPDEVAAILSGPVGMEFPKNLDGVRVNFKLDEVRQKALGKSIQAQRAASSRWTAKAVQAATPDPKPKKKRVNGREELSAAIAEHDERNPGKMPIPSSLAEQLESYRAMRSAESYPPWRRGVWLKNLGEDFSYEEWEEGYKQATRSLWRSVHPKKRYTPGRGGSFKPSKFGSDAPPINLPPDTSYVDNSNKIVDKFVDPNKSPWSFDE